MLSVDQNSDKVLPLDENSDIVLAAGHLGLECREHLHGGLGLGIEVVLPSQRQFS